MKTNLPALRRDAAARLPNSMVVGRTFWQLTPLAAKLLLLMAHAWGERMQDLKRQGISLDQCVTEQRRFTTRWSHLAGYLAPDTSTFRTRDYRALREAAKTLRGFFVERERISADGRPVYDAINILSSVHVEGGAEFTFTLTEDFARALRILVEDGHFTLVELRDAQAMPSTRALIALMLARRVAGFDRADKRTYSVDAIRAIFGLTGKAYEAWNQVAGKLNGYVSAVNAKTAFHIRLVPQKPDGYRVSSIRFDVHRVGAASKADADKFDALAAQLRPKLRARPKTRIGRRTQAPPEVHDPFAAFDAQMLAQAGETIKGPQRRASPQLQDAIETDVWDR